MEPELEWFKKKLEPTDPKESISRLPGVKVG